MDTVISEQVSKRLPIAAMFGKSWYKREDRDKFSNGMTVIPAHEDEETVPNLERLSEVRILEDTTQEFKNCDGTIDYFEHKKTNASILTTVVNDELLMSYLDILDATEHTELLEDAVSIDGMSIGQWLTHAKANPGTVYRSEFSKWLAKDL